MTSLDDLMFLDNEDLISEVERAGEMANQEFAHELGDSAMVIFLLRCADGEVTAREAQEMVGAYQELNRRFG